MRAAARYWRYGVAAGALGLLLAFVGPSSLAEALGRAEPGWLAAYAVGFALTPVLYGIQIHRGLGTLGYDIGRRHTISAAISAWSIGLLTPARAGDLSLGGFLRPEVPVAAATATVIIDKLASLAVLSLVAAGATAGTGANVVPAVFAASVLVFLMVAAVFGAICAPAAERLVLAAIPARFRDRVQGVVSTTRDVSKNAAFLRITATMVCARWAGMFCLNAFLFRALGVSPGVLVVMAATSVGRIIALLPLSVGGVGLKEPVQILIYETAGIPDETVVAVSVLGLVVMYLVAGLLPLLSRTQVRTVRQRHA